MDEALKAALEIVQAQAGTRMMTTEEITSLTTALVATIRALDGGSFAGSEAIEGASACPHGYGKKSIKEKSITCLVCGKSFKVLTKKHLATHGMSPDGYRATYGIKKGTGLVARFLARERRTKMKDMKLWTRRGNAKAATEAVQ